MLSGLQLFSDRILSKDENAILRAEASKRFPDEKEATEFLELCKDADYTVGSVTIKPGTQITCSAFHNFNTSAGSLQKTWISLLPRQWLLLRSFMKQER